MAGISTSPKMRNDVKQNIEVKFVRSPSHHYCGLYFLLESASKMKVMYLPDGKIMRHLRTPGCTIRYIGLHFGSGAGVPAIRTCIHEPVGEGIVLFL